MTITGNPETEQQAHRNCLRCHYTCERITFEKAFVEGNRDPLNQRGPLSRRDARFSDK